MNRCRMPAVCALIFAASTPAEPQSHVDARRQLFLDDALIQRMERAELRLHHPIDREVVLVFDRPWEGEVSGYITVFEDENRFRMYYRASHYDRETRKVSHENTCYAESRDGITWTRPEFGLYEFNGSTANNIVYKGAGISHNFTPFKDTNPACPPDAKYKGVSADATRGMLTHHSPDGIHWEQTSETPILTKGKFDSQNLVFYDNVRRAYVAFFRDFKDGIRGIKTSTSQDCFQWSEPEWLDFGDTPAEHLYTNAVVPCPRAPHLFVGFPMRFLPDRQQDWHPIEGVSDGVFMSSNDGFRWHRWREAFLRPGPQKQRWASRNNMIAWGVLTTKSDQPGCPDELSIYSSEGYYQDEGRLRRHTLRMDGFVSVHAAFPAGEIVTKPLVFAGERLTINYASSAAGSIRIELQDAQGTPIPGFRLEEAVEMWGDDIDATVSWESGGDVGPLAGKPVRLRAVMMDADWYSFRFVADDPAQEMTHANTLRYCGGTGPAGP